MESTELETIHDLILSGPAPPDAAPGMGNASAK